jgi:hypothetical protein
MTRQGEFIPVDRGEVKLNRVIAQTRKDYARAMKWITKWIKENMDPVYFLPTGEINLNVFDILTFQDILVSKYNTGNCKAASLSTYRSAL